MPNKYVDTCENSTRERPCTIITLPHGNQNNYPSWRTVMHSRLIALSVVTKMTTWKESLCRRFCPPKKSITSSWTIEEMCGIIARPGTSPETTTTSWKSLTRQGLLLATMWATILIRTRLICLKWGLGYATSSETSRLLFLRKNNWWSKPQLGRTLSCCLQLTL